MSEDAMPEPMPAGHEADEAEQRVRSAVKDCVHCGFCLPACPTYSLWGEEMDSPRGRIHLVSQLLDGAPLTPATAEPLRPVPRLHGVHDRLPVRGAVRPDHRGGQGVDRGRGQPAGGRRGRRRRGRARPGAAVGEVGGAGWAGGVGVRLGRRRAAAGAGGSGAVGPEPTAPRPLADRLTREAIFALFPYPRRLRVATAPLRLAQRTGADRLLARTGLVGRVSPAAEQALRLAPASRPAPPGRLPERVAALGTRRAVVGMLTGCVQSVFFPGVNAATARVLAAEGCDVIIPRSQGCCGALSLHSGRVAEAARFARQTIARSRRRAWTRSS